MTRRGLLVSPALAALAALGPVALGSRRELFLDSFLIAELRGVQLRLGQPVDAGTALSFDHPWEGRFTNYATVIAHQGRYRLYYRGVPSAGADGRDQEVYCYAESSDGVKFTRPDLRIHPARGTNVILAGTPPLQHNFSPFLDRDGTYKGLAGTNKSGLVAFQSSDGIRWSTIRPEPVLTGGAFDSQNISFWSESEGRYVCYYRTFKQIGNTRYRWVSRAVSRNFLDWDKQGELDFGDAPPEHLYTNQTAAYFRAPHLYVSLCARFFPGKQVLSDAEAKAIGVDPAYFKDCSDAVLMSSRGGLRFDRTFLEAFLRPGLGLSNWVSRSNYPALNLVPAGKEQMAFYVVRDYGQESIQLRRYVLRLDGFASVAGAYRGGELITKPFTFTGSQLEVNFATSAAGSITAHLESPAGVSLAVSESMTGDSTARNLRWRSRDGLGEWSGKAVRLRVLLRDADLYSIRFH